MIAAQLIEMLQLQSTLNTRVDPDWVTKGHNWSRAAFVESAELLDHVGWKWWKAQPLNKEQAHLELVDIWHFMMSDVLTETEGRIQPAALRMLEDWETPISKVFVSDGVEHPTCVADLPLQTRIQVFGSLAGLTGTMMPALFRNICDELGLTSTRLYEMYLQKNVLNLFRQDKGYQEGQYIKVWDGKEDNVVLMEIIEELPRLTRDTLYDALAKRYPGT